MFVIGIPGIFGFIAWELKENWRLYRANRPLRLRPVMLGSHGESMRGLLRPGFHSGTIPKLFRKLRHASRSKAAWLHHDLDHAAEGVHRFAERESDRSSRSLVPDWGAITDSVEAVRFGCQRLVIELAVPTSARPVRARVRERRRRIEAVDRAGRLGGQTNRAATSLRSSRRCADSSTWRRSSGSTAATGSNLPAHSGRDLRTLHGRITWAEWVARWTLSAAAKGESRDGSLNVAPPEIQL